MKNNKNGKIKNTKRTARRTLIIISTCVLLVIAAVLMLIILTDDERRSDTQQAVPKETPLYTPFVAEESMGDIVESLRGTTWQDKYDANYRLRFDELPSVATETNSFTGTSRTFSISSKDDTLYLVEGQSYYAFRVSEGSLLLNFGDPVGVVEYVLVPAGNE